MDPGTVSTDLFLSSWQNYFSGKIWKWPPPIRASSSRKLAPTHWYIVKVDFMPYVSIAITMRLFWQAVKQKLTKVRRKGWLDQNMLPPHTHHTQKFQVKQIYLVSQSIYEDESCVWMCVTRGVSNSKWGIHLRANQTSVLYHDFPVFTCQKRLIRPVFVANSRHPKAFHFLSRTQANFPHQEDSTLYIGIRNQIKLIVPQLYLFNHLWDNSDG